MSWSPPGKGPEAARDRRLDAFRGRAARVFDDEGAVLSTLYVQTEFRWHHSGGHLWWRRWSHPEEFALSHHVSEKTHTITVHAGDHLDAALGDWLAGRIEHSGTVLTLAWLEPTESRQVQQDIGLPGA